MTEQAKTRKGRARTLSMQSLDPAEGEPVNGTRLSSRRACRLPSSPAPPCSAMKTIAPAALASATKAATGSLRAAADGPKSGAIVGAEEEGLAPAPLPATPAAGCSAAASSARTTATSGPGGVRQASTTSSTVCLRMAA